MAKIIVSGASGQFGHAAASQLLDMGEEVIALSRSTDKLADLAKRGADVRAADFDSPDGLEEAMAGGDKLLLISTTMVGQRPRQHGNAIDAAKAAGVKHIVYTSVTDGGNPDHPAVEQHDHYATEQLLKDSGLELTKYGEIQIDARGATNLPGIFAAGDCTTVPYKQIVISMGEGSKAALSAFDFLIRNSVDESEDEAA